MTEQEKNPHGKLVECRNAVERVLNLTRKHAATVCNKLTHQQVEAVLAAGDNAEKMQRAVEPIEPEPPKPQEKKTDTKTKK